MNSAQNKSHKKAYSVSAKKISQKGFTLIELLIVIVVIGILSGVLLSVINPAQQQEKANQAVMRSNLEKLHMAQLACVNSRVDPATACDDITELGVNDPAGEPTDNTYYLVGASGGNLTVTANDDPDGSNTVTDGDCVMTYNYNISAGTVSKGSQDADCLVDFAD